MRARAEPFHLRGERFVFFIGDQLVNLKPAFERFADHDLALDEDFPAFCASGAFAQSAQCPNHRIFRAGNQVH